MITDNSHIIGKLPGNLVLVTKTPDRDNTQSREQNITESLKRRDMEVRIHESSHGNDPNLIKIGPTQYDYTIGPDGRAYATGGKITLSTGRADNPSQALLQAEALKKASMPTGEPSAQDLSALSAAITMEYEARNMTYSEDKTFNKSRTDIKGLLLNTYA